MGWGVGKQGPGGGNGPSKGHKTTPSLGTVPSPKKGLNGGGSEPGGVLSKMGQVGKSLQGKPSEECGFYSKDTGRDMGEWVSGIHPHVSGAELGAETQ